LQESLPSPCPCVARLVGQVEKVLVLADDDSVMGERPRPQGTVVWPALEILIQSV